MRRFYPKTIVQQFALSSARSPTKCQRIRLPDRSSQPASETETIANRSDRPRQNRGSRAPGPQDARPPCRRGRNRPSQRDDARAGGVRANAVDDGRRASDDRY